MVTVNGAKSLYGLMSRVVYILRACRDQSVGPCYIFNVQLTINGLLNT